MKLSIIIPVYNVEKYLERCLNSILEQDTSKQEYEIILVNDGSKDDSARIAKNYTSKFSNIRLINKVNGGLSSARNEGLKFAEGDYVWFVDSDDWIVTGVLDKLFAFEKGKDLDVFFFDFQRVDSAGNITSADKFIKTSDKIESGIDVLVNKKIRICAWNSWVRKSFLLQKFPHNPFIEGIYYEDVMYILPLLHSAKNVSYCSVVVYNYFINSGSILNNSNIHHKEKLVNSRIIAIENLIDFRSEIKEEKIKNRIKDYVDEFKEIIIEQLIFIDFSKDFELKTIQYLKAKKLYPFAFYADKNVTGYSKILTKYINSENVYFSTYSKKRMIGNALKKTYTSALNLFYSMRK